MSFMKMQIFKKGATYCADCSRCGATQYTHERAHVDHNARRDAMQDGTLCCDDCRVGAVDPDTFIDCGKQYAGRYFAPGYMDCTSLHYSKNLRELKRELRDCYGDAE